MDSATAGAIFFGTISLIAIGWFFVKDRFRKNTRWSKREFMFWGRVARLIRLVTRKNVFMSDQIWAIGHVAHVVPMKYEGMKEDDRPPLWLIVLEEEYLKRPAITRWWWARKQERRMHPREREMFRAMIKSNKEE